MKIQCNICEFAEANVLCCADNAALCWSCDNNVHSLNNLASNHHRVPLTDSSSVMPNCDICQETVGHFFCMEDRALFCRKCDVAIHSVNSLVSSHQRYLMTGVKVGSVEVGPSNMRTPQALVANQPNPISTLVDDVAGGSSTPMILPSDGGSQIDTEWLDEYLQPVEFNETYGFMGYNSLSNV
ncbi:B-box zinc finger protein 22-like [Impatiens glandulifera]|uniref:B-box zinc finger protein 22-like n=1 Tax=Impatiens glandulifera TaxID=253017 RepID=UPI001FB15F30|nr:B-box zinc finger protein 22-like [Impatiens glandulifera]